MALASFLEYAYYSIAYWFSDGPKIVLVELSNYEIIFFSVAKKNHHSKTMDKKAAEYQTLYINSYTQKISGDDCSFTVDLGAPKTINTVQLDCAIIECVLANFYES